MTATVDPPLLTKRKSYEQWKLETLAWTEITDVCSEKQTITVALLLPEDHESGIAENVFEQLDLEELKKENRISTRLVFLYKHLGKMTQLTLWKILKTLTILKEKRNNHYTNMYQCVILNIERLKRSI